MSLLTSLLAPGNGTSQSGARLAVPAPTGVAATDTAAIQAVIDGTLEGFPINPRP